MNFSTWLNTFIDEKQIDREQVLEVEGTVYGTNYIPVQCVLDSILTTAKEEQRAIKDMMVKIDYVNGDIVRYLKHLAQAITL
jgi:hypothetical protein